MRNIVSIMAAGVLVVSAVTLVAQPPPRGPGGPGGAPTNGVDAFIARMMTFDKDQDGKLAKDEITDARLKPLFERADADHDGVVAKAELTALYTKEASESANGGVDLRTRGVLKPQDRLARSCGGSLTIARFPSAAWFLSARP